MNHSKTPTAELLPVIASYLGAPCSYTEVMVNKPSKPCAGKLTLRRLTFIEESVGWVTDFTLHLRSIDSITPEEAVEIWGEVFGSDDTPKGLIPVLINGHLSGKSMIPVNTANAILWACRRRHILVDPCLLEAGIATIEPVKEKSNG